MFVRYQFVIEAYDTAYPDNKAVSQTTINIKRNLHAPILNPADYVTRITDEYLAPGSALNITVKATNQDDPVSRLFSSFPHVNHCCVLKLKIKYLLHVNHWNYKL